MAPSEFEADVPAYQCQGRRSDELELLCLASIRPVRCKRPSESTGRIMNWFGSSDSASDLLLDLDNDEGHMERGHGRTDKDSPVHKPG
jgi:hypothetical protein